MPIEIAMPTRFELRLNEGKLDRPALEAFPTGDNTPYISAITYAVTGSPEELAAEIQSMYKSVRLSEPRPFKERRELTIDPQTLNGSLPEKVDCVLDVTIEYYNSDSTGQPITSRLQKANAQCQLYIKPFFEKEPQPNQEKPTYLNGKKSEDTSDFPDKLQQSYPGWLAIDYGTSNSTVTLFDPKLSYLPPILPIEQLTFLRKELGNWLDGKSGLSLSKTHINSWNQLTDDLRKTLEINVASDFTEEIHKGDEGEGLIKVQKALELVLAGHRDENFS